MKEQGNDSLIRQLVLDILLEVTVHEEFSHIAIRNVLNKYNYLTTREKALIKRITEGTLERRITIDYCLNRYSKTKTTKMKPVILNILRMGVYQIVYMDGVYDTQACNEAVKLAQKRGFQGLKGYVNGVLRTIVREKDKIEYPVREKDEQLWMSVMYSVPQWLVNLWVQQYGISVTETMLKASLEERPISIRMDENVSEKRVQEIVQQIKEQQISIEESSYLPYAYTLTATDNVRNLAGFAEGEIYVQDISSMLVAQVAGVQEGYEVLDVCAAPGGKSLHIASKLHHAGHVTARDVSDYKVSLIRQNMEKSSYKNISCEVGDATIRDENSCLRYDLVIADLPCSGLGVIAKKSDIRYRASEDKLSDLVVLQQSILQVVQEYVKPGGTLIFSTCTVNKEENEENAKWFAANFSFRLESFREQLPTSLQKEEQDGMLQLIPGVHDCDGFFIAKFRKEA